MFSQEDIDAVLNDAQQAVDTLSDDVTNLVEKPSQETGDVTPASAEAPPAPAATPAPEAVPPPAKTAPNRIERTLKLKVPVVVRLAERRMLLSEIMKITPGTVLEFARTVDEELDLLANNHQIGNGVAVKVNERFGLRVTYVGDIKHRINSLGAHRAVQ